MWCPSASVLFSSGGARVVKSRSAEIHGDTTAHEGNDWLDMMWTFVISLVAPDEEEEGIHQLTETFTCKKVSHTNQNVLHKNMIVFQNSPAKYKASPAGYFYYHFNLRFFRCVLVVEEFSTF